MKKVLALLMVAGMFSLVACGPSEEEKAEAEAAMNEMVEGLDAAMEEVVEEVEEETTVLAAHVCDDKCADGCTGPRCGEEGHECSDACHAEGEDHEHAEGEEHDHSEE
ncbi:MAG: hypothetical protein P1U41_04015 [Vicingaceae bacterium]|nr:hypothetical protein [Vicingaceae bacterium]